MILNDLRSNRFTILEFYDRRARRILPALLFMVLICIPISWFLFLPNHFQDFGQSIVGVATFSSNYLFWLESDYFDNSSELKPLLHTWSLAVEEQYYLFFPVLMLFIWANFKKYMIHILFVILFSSFIFANWASANYQSFSFYGLPSRGWELLVGSFGAIYSSKNYIFNSVVKNSLSILGFVMILYSIFTFDKTTPFPGSYTLLPVLGTFLILIFNDKSNLITQLFSYKIFVYIGLISYSLYLWHQPILAFARYGTDTVLSGTSIIFLILLTFVISVISYKYVETPFRSKSYSEKFTKKIRLIIWLAICLIFILIGSIIHFNKGMPGRFDNLIKAFPSTFKNYNFDNEELKQKTKEIREKNILFSESSKINLLLIGDSHADDLFMALHLNKKLLQNFSISKIKTDLSCFNWMDKKEIKDIIISNKNFMLSDRIIITSRYQDNSYCEILKKTGSDYDGIEKLISFIKPYKKQVSITSNHVEYPTKGLFAFSDNLLINEYRFGDINQEQLITKLNKKHYSYASDMTATNNRIKEIVYRNNLQYLDKRKYQCDETKKYCTGIIDTGHKSHFDYGHYTLKGAEHFGKVINEINWLQNE